MVAILRSGRTFSSKASHEAGYVIPIVNGIPYIWAPDRRSSFDTKEVTAIWIFDLLFGLVT